MKQENMGAITIIGGLAGIVIGAIAGVEFAGELTQYAKHAAEHADTLGYIVSQNPSLTYGISAGVGASIGGFVGIIPGRVIDTFKK